MVREIQRDPTGHVLLTNSTRRPDGVIVVYREGLQEFLHRRLYRLLVDPLLGRERLARTCPVVGCLNPHHWRGTGERVKGSPDRCRNGHEYTEENTLPSGHCRICTEYRKERRKGTGMNGGELNASKVECPHGHSYLDPNNVYLYRTRSGWHRKCRACAREQAAARRFALAARPTGD